MTIDKGNVCQSNYQAMRKRILSFLLIMGVLASTKVFAYDGNTNDALNDYSIFSVGFFVFIIGISGIIIGMYFFIITIPMNIKLLKSVYGDLTFSKFLSFYFYNYLVSFLIIGLGLIIKYGKAIESMGDSGLLTILIGFGTITYTATSNYFYHYFKRTRDWSFKEREDFTLKIFRGFIVFCLLLAIIPHIFWNKDVVIYPGSNKYHEIRVNCTSHNIHEYDGKIMTEFDAFFHLHFQKCKECDF